MRLLVRSHEEQVERATVAYARLFMQAARLRRKLAVADAAAEAQLAQVQALSRRDLRDEAEREEALARVDAVNAKKHEPSELEVDLSGEAPPQRLEVPRSQRGAGSDYCEAAHAAAESEPPPVGVVVEVQTEAFGGCADLST